MGGVQTWRSPGGFAPARLGYKYRLIGYGVHVIGYSVEEEGWHKVGLAVEVRVPLLYSL